MSRSAGSRSPSSEWSMHAEILRKKPEARAVIHAHAPMVEIIERSAELILGCHAVGKEPPMLPDGAVEALRAMGDLVA